MKKYEIITRNFDLEIQKQELHQIIEGINNPKLINYLLNLIKNFLELRS